MAIRTPVYTQAGEFAGDVARKTFYTTRRRSIHRLRRPPAWTIERVMFYDLTHVGVERVELHDQETGQTYTASVSDFWQYGFAIDRGRIIEIALPLVYWRVDGQPSQIERARLAEREAARAAQLSIWDCAQTH